MASRGSAVLRRLGAVLIAAACAGTLPGAARADVGDPVAPTATTAWLAKIVTPVQVHDGAADSTPVTSSVDTTTHWGGQSQLLVRGSARTAGVLWLDVQLAGRPNGHHGWIHGDAAQLSTTPWRIEIKRSTKTLRLLNAGRRRRAFKVVVGAAATPTPAGHFALLDKLSVRDTDNFLGSWVLPLTAYSDVLQTFDGGPGQIALHGRGGASLKVPTGTAASHGCVRITNADIAHLAATVPTGTPVDVL